MVPALQTRTTELLTTHRADGDSAVTMSPLPIGVLTAPGADCSPGRNCYRSHLWLEAIPPKLATTCRLSMSL